MNKEVRVLQFFKLMLITSPLLGAISTLPGLFFQRFEPSRTAKWFLIATLLTIIIWLINIALVSIFFRNNFFKKNTYLRRALILIIASIIILLVEHKFSVFAPRPPQRLMQKLPDGVIKPLPPPSGNIGIIVQMFLLNLIVMALIEFDLLKTKKKEVDLENMKLRYANMQAKNLLLNNQLHPHFLFNSLSTLKSLISTNPDTAATYLIKLSDILRRAISNNDQVLVPLKDELSLCSNYLDMQKIRFEQALLFEINIPENLVTGGLVPAYSIQLCVENAIKHNKITANAPLQLKITGNEAAQSICISNNLQPIQYKDEGMSGVGLSNLSERYELLGAEAVTITQNSRDFSVTIKVLHNEDFNN